MKRRDFLKILGIAVVAPGTVIAAIKAKPKPEIEFGIPYWCKKAALDTKRADGSPVFRLEWPKSCGKLIYFRGQKIYYQSPLSDD